MPQFTNNRTILITGANKGIGFETARRCGEAGFHVIASGRDEGRLQKALAKLRKEKINADSLLMDVSSQESIDAAAVQFRTFGLEIDALVNNAAISVKGDKNLSRADEKILQETLQTNCYGALRTTKAFLPFMKTPGRIVMISSGAGSMSDEVATYSPAYCVSKTLLNAITRQLAHELKGKNISVNAVCPGWVRTDMGGMLASRSVAKGAETPVWLATEAPQSLTGKFFRDKEEILW
jgi:NAD(P)-dependent dehydrogenase (short-subunit alcohol dehydrogenase family)